MLTVGGWILIVASFLVLLWLGERRARCLEEKLARSVSREELEAERSRVQRLAEAADADRAAREGDMELVEQEIAALRRQVEQLQAKVEQMEQALSSRRAEQERDNDNDSEAALLTNGLETLGYERVRIVGPAREVDSSELSSGGEEGAAQRFLVEARRRGTTFKGSVELADGRIGRVSLTPAFPLFP